MIIMEYKTIANVAIALTMMLSPMGAMASQSSYEVRQDKFIECVDNAVEHIDIHRVTFPEFQKALSVCEYEATDNSLYQ